MALLQSLPLPLGSALIPFSLPDADGKTHSSDEYADRKVLIVMFICNHCPYVQGIRNQLIDLQAGFDSKEVQCIGINSNDAGEYPDDSPEEMKKAIQEFGINFPYLVDETQEVAKKYQAQCTPDIFVFDAEKRLAYHGRVQELKAAIDALLRGGKPSEEQHPSMGCSIKWKSGVE